MACKPVQNAPADGDNEAAMSAIASMAGDNACGIE
jgi:hypothetical protein